MPLTTLKGEYHMKRILIAVIAGIIVTSCGTVNNALLEKTKSEEYYRIFDIRTSADKKLVIKAASDGLGRNVGHANEATPIPSGTIPDAPGRFTLVNPFEGTRLGALAGGAGSTGMRIATCEGAVWSARATKNVEGSYNLNLSACLFPYSQGYHLDLYAVFMKKQGGLKELSRIMASAMVGTPEQWTEKTFLDIVRSIRERTGASITYLEGHPELSGTPWLDQGETFKEEPK